jgi:hypothetical protein
MIRFACPNCGKNLKAPAGAAGRIIRCPQCRGRIEVPFVYQDEAPPVRSRPVRGELSAATSADVPYVPPAFSTPEWESPARPSKTGPLAVSLAVVAGLFLVIVLIVMVRTKGPEESTVVQRTDPQPVSLPRIGPRLAPRLAPPEDPEPASQEREQPQPAQPDERKMKPNRKPRTEEEEPEPVIRPPVPLSPKDAAPKEVENKPEEEKKLTPNRLRLGKLPVASRENGEAKELPAKDYKASCEAARAKLLQGFETEIEALRKQNRPVGEKLKSIDIVKKEKERFENRGLIPWSEPMRRHVDPYLDALTAAQKKLRIAYESLIEKELQARNDDQVENLRSEWKKRLDVKVMAQWRHIVNGNGPGRVYTLYSNGRINDSEGDAPWEYAKGVLIFAWSAPNAPEGRWLDILEVSADGTTYAGTNNDKPEKRPKLTGVNMLVEKAGK